MKKILLLLVLVLAVQVSYGQFDEHVTYTQAQIDAINTGFTAGEGDLYQVNETPADPLTALNRWYIGMSDGSLQLITNGLTITDPNSGEVIGTITDADGNVFSIEETLTTIENGVAGHLIANYRDEAGALNAINETTTTIENGVAGHLIANYRDEAGALNAINETITSITEHTTTPDGSIYFLDETGSIATSVAKAKVVEAPLPADLGKYFYTNGDATQDVTINTNAISNPYDNTASGLGAVNVQEAIDEIVSTASAYGEIIDTAGGEEILASGTFVDFGTTNIPTATYYSTGGEDLIIDAAILTGTYRVSYRVGLEMTAGNTRTAVEFELQKGAAGSEVTIPGTFSSVVLRNKDFKYNTATVVKIIQLNAGERIFVKATKTLGGATVNTAANGSSLLIEKI